MRVPIAWLREYVDLPDSAQAIADRLAMLGFPVDAIEERPQLRGVVIGRIAALEKHPNADRLQVGSIDVGAEKPLTIATAATNVAQGQTIAVATIGAQLPLLKIERRTMRGVESEGMMISGEELALPSDWFEDGIMQFDAALVPGTDVIEHFHLNDAVLDVDVTSNRPDALSMIGLARELAAALGVRLRLPLFENPGTRADEPGKQPRVTIESPDCTRFVAQRFDRIRVAPAPSWMRIRLALAGQRPINNLVDISNYVMLETGQPLHFYDDAKIADRHLIVRDADAGESFAALDGVTYALTPQILTIRDARGPQALAGLKGGASSEVDANTNAIVLESANFTGARVRRASAQLGFRTEASSRHEKALAPALTDIGAARAASLLAELGAMAYAPLAFGAALSEPEAIAFHPSDVERLLGFALDTATIAQHLRALGFHVAPESGHLRVVPPPWRRDVTVTADVVEEIARMVGYDAIAPADPAVYPQHITSTAYRLERKLAHRLAALTYNEIVTYSLHGASVFDKLFAAAVQPSHRSVEVRNPLSEDQRYLRYALGPGIVAYFARAGKPARVFEIGHTFWQDDAHVIETPQLVFGFTSALSDDVDAAFLRITGDAEELVRSMTGRVPDSTADRRPGLHPGKSAALLIDGHEVALLGQIDPRVCKTFDVPYSAHICFMYLDALPDYRTPRYVPPSRFPSTYRDLALVVALDVTAARISSTARRAAGEICTGARVFDEYRGPQVGENRKSVALRLALQRSDTTITDAEADAVVARALEALRAELDATLRT